MVVDQQDVQSMAKLLQVWNDTVAHLDDANAETLIETTTDPAAVAVAVKASEGETLTMRDLMSRIESASDTVTQKLNEEGKVDRELRYALKTEKTTTGMKIGLWEVKSHTTTGMKRFDIVLSDSNMMLAEGLTVYAIAKRLIEHLNDGGKINSIEALRLLLAERDYSQAISDMILFKHRLQKGSDTVAFEILEDRYESAKDRAVTAKSVIDKLCK